MAETRPAGPPAPPQRTTGPYPCSRWGRTRIQPRATESMQEVLERTGGKVPPVAATAPYGTLKTPTGSTQERIEESERNGPAAELDDAPPSPAPLLKIALDAFFGTPRCSPPESEPTPVSFRLPCRRSRQSGGPLGDGTPVVKLSPSREFESRPPGGQRAPLSATIPKWVFPRPRRPTPFAPWRRWRIRTNIPGNRHVNSHRTRLRPPFQMAISPFNPAVFPPKSRGPHLRPKKNLVRKTNPGYPGPWRHAPPGVVGVDKIARGFVDPAREIVSFGGSGHPASPTKRPSSEIKRE